MFLNKSNKTLFVLSVIVLRLLFDAIYIKVISPSFAYAGLKYLPSVDASISSWAILIGGLLLVIPFLNRKDFVVPNAAILLFTLFFVPWTSFIGCKEQKVDFIFCESLFWYMTFLMLHKKFSFHMFRKTGKGDDIAIMLITIIVIFTIIYISGTYAHFRLKFDLKDVYDLRREASKFAVPTFFAYIRAASSNVLPILVVYFISQKKWWIVGVLGFIIVMNFSINGSKSTFFKLFLCFILYYSTNTDFKYKVSFFLAIFVGLGLIEYLSLHTSFISTIIVRRTFYVTSLLDSYYYEVIHQYGPAYFSHQINGRDIQFYIGYLFFDRDSMRANNGLFSDAFMNLGWIGCFVYPVIYALLLNICEQVFKGLKVQIKFYAVFLIVLTLRSAELTTALLTHGLFLLCLTMYFMAGVAPPKTYSSKPYRY